MLYSGFTGADVQCTERTTDVVARGDMSTQEVFVQQFAALFHHYQAALSPDSQEPPEPTSSGWKSVPTDDRNRLMAAARLAILEMETNARLEENSRKYFAKPGQAEWGC
jgi:hypothetical protein